jgi:osmotically-inducible protein OsmY
MAFRRRDRSTNSSIDEDPGQERAMTARRELQNIRTIVLSVIVLTLVAMSAGGCNTSQAPNRQFTDSQITTQVKAKLASDVGASSLTNIDVNTTNGVVTLAGQVDSANLKHSAETVTASVPGVVRVNDNLQVAPTAGSVNR